MDLSTLYLGACIGYWVFQGIKSWLQEGENSGQNLCTSDIRQPELSAGALLQRATPEQGSRKQYASAADLIRDTYVSYSKLRRYQECPHKFYLTYLTGICEDESPFTGDGKVFHEYAESTLTPFVGDSIAEAKQEVGRDRRLRRLLRHLPEDSEIQAIEHRLRFTLRGIHYFGIVDLILTDADGVTHLVDYKTGQNPKIHLEQLELYCMPVLLRSVETRIRCSFILVDTDCHVQWEVGPGNRNTVIRNLIRRVNALTRDTQLKPFVNSRCKDCTVSYACSHRDAPHSAKRPVPTLTSGVRGASARMGELRRAKFTKSRTKTRGPCNARSFRAVVGKADYRCAETGRVISVGERHFTTHKGERLCVAGFQQRFPGLSLPAERIRRSGVRGHGDAKSFHPVVGKRDYMCTETGRLIPTGERHYATHKGKRLCVAGFQKRFPGFPLPAE